MSVESTGTVDFKVGTDTYQTWYKIVGDIKASKHRPLVIVHGGPGMTHHYMLPHETIFAKTGIPVIFYDQIGNGSSSICKDAPPEFWTPELFMDELDNILQALGVENDFDLLGQSWGGMLVAQYAATRLPKGLKRLIIANAPASMELASIGTDQLLERFPPEFQKSVRKHESEGTQESEEYQALVSEFYNKHVCTIDPWPKDVNTTFELLMTNPGVYQAMVGPSEFNVIGSLKDWSIVDVIHKIAVPTLLISAPLDEIQEISVLPFFEKIPKIKWVELQNSTHLGMYEEPERYFEVVLSFLNNTLV
ncbi:L-amino acid amidase [Psilocybe cubensis]|uniref:L-amino acid amidase n=2 Tax=Psilocybe cubensis TaxID=181762 RepID=A0ACB8GUB8_PSICU|nr:L-amino acid amidase [Psilocybe cubensis]KAH9478580.1 L-amino acid amidase [Psilocybe cubensis]